MAQPSKKKNRRSLFKRLSTLSLRRSKRKKKSPTELNVTAPQLAVVVPASPKKSVLINEVSLAHQEDSGTAPVNFMNDCEVISTSFREETAVASAKEDICLVVVPASPKSVLIDDANLANQEDSDATSINFMNDSEEILTSFREEKTETSIASAEDISLESIKTDELSVCETAQSNNIQPTVDEGVGYQDSACSELSEFTAACFDSTIANKDVDLENGSKGKPFTSSLVCPVLEGVEALAVDMVSLDGTEMRGHKDETEMMPESAIEQTELSTTNQTPDTSLNIYAIGTLVQVIAGTYKGKHGKSQGLTKSEKSIRIDFQDGSDPKCLRINSVRPSACEESSGGNNDDSIVKGAITDTSIETKQLFTHDGAGRGHHSSFQQNINEGSECQDSAHSSLYGTRLQVVSGTYKNKHGICQGLTKSGKSIRIDFQDGSDPKCLRVTSVCPIACGESWNLIRSSEVNDEKCCNISGETLEERSTPFQTKANARPTEVQTQNPPGTSNEAEISVGDELYVINGKYRERTGTVTKVCPKTVKVCFLGDENSVSIRHGSVTPLALRKEDIEDFRIPEYKEGGLRIGGQVVNKISFEENEGPMENISFFHHMLGRRILTEQHSIKSGLKIKVNIQDMLGKFELISTRLVKSQTDCFFQKANDVQCTYIQTEGPGITSVSASSLLSRVASFSSLSSRKVKSRLELFQSPAYNCKATGRRLLEFYDNSIFEDIAEMGHVGCGFICEDLLKELLGNDSLARKAICIQCRLFIPRKGVYKGMLMKKKIESGAKILLPESMKKIPASTESDVSDKGCLLVNLAGVDPSSNNENMGRLPYIDPNAKKEVQKSFHPKKLGEMYLRLFRSLHVPDDIIKNYAKMSSGKVGETGVPTIRHASLRGVADPTGNIPANSVFITGISNADHFPSTIFITRSPCIKSSDGLTIKVVTEKPASMRDEDYIWLNSLPFGSIIFGFPESGYKPIPELIANGDLDGCVLIV